MTKKKQPAAKAPAAKRPTTKNTARGRAPSKSSKPGQSKSPAATVNLVPRLIVRDAAAAINFYVESLGAVEHTRFADPTGFVVHAELSVGGARFTLAEESRDWGNHAPPSLTGSAVILTLEVNDADAVANGLVGGGASVLFPVADQFYGRREGRLQDPFGHIWVVTQSIKQMSDEEIQAGVTAMGNVSEHAPPE